MQYVPVPGPLRLILVSESPVLFDRQALRVVLDGLGKDPLRIIRAAEVPVRHTLPRPVAHLLSNRQALRVVLNGLSSAGLVAHLL